MLASSGLSDDALFSEALSEENLADGVINLMRTGVKEIFTLEVNFGSAKFLGPALGVVERGGTAAVVLQKVIEFSLEGRVGLG